MMERVLYTIGHSNRAAERLIELLRQQGIAAVADVRSQPYSRFNPQFNREPLATTLKNAGIEYVFLGQELGARSEDPACYRDGRAQYSLMAKTPLFERGIERLLAGMDRFRLAVMCAEKEPLSCHRFLLISRYLHEKGVKVIHILEDGTLEDHEASLLRLLELHGMQQNQNHLFNSREELAAIAYDKQAEDIQYATTHESQTA